MVPGAFEGNTGRFCKLASCSFSSSSSSRPGQLFLSPVRSRFHREGKPVCFSLTPSFLLTRVSCHSTVGKSFFFFSICMFTYHYQHGIWVSPFTGVAYIPVFIYFDAQIVPHLAMWVLAGSCVSVTHPLPVVQACPIF